MRPTETRHGGGEWLSLADVAADHQLTAPELARWIRGCGFAGDLDSAIRPTYARRWAIEATVAVMERRGR